MNHVAVIQRNYADAIISGEKSIESRLSRNRCPPFGLVNPGDTIYFKQSSGPYRLRARVSATESFGNLTPGEIRELRATYNGDIGAPPRYWSTKRTARYATLIWLSSVREISTGPDIPPLHGRGWLVLAPTKNPRPKRNHRP